MIYNGLLLALPRASALPVVALLWLTLATSLRGENMTGLKSHPCLLFNAETQAELKAKAADAQPNRFGFSTAETWDEIRKKADEFVKAPTYRYRVQIPANADQPTEPWEYTLSAQMPPRHDRTTWYPPWTAMFQERSDSISTRLKHLAFAYAVTGEPGYFERAKEIALCLTKWAQWTDPSYTAGKTRACLDTGHAAQNVALFYDWCFDALTPAEREEIRAALVEKGIKAILSDVDRYPANTNGYAVLTTGLGLAALAVRPEDPRGGEWLEAAVAKTRHSLDLHGKDGGALEGPGYGTYLLDSFATFLDALVSSQAEHTLFAHPFLATMDRYCIGLLAPDTKQQPCFGDGSPTQPYPQTMRILAQRGSTDAAWYLQQIGALRPTDIHGWIRFDAAKLNPTPPTWNPSSVFVDIGYASLRDGYNANAPFLAFKCGPPEHNIGHNHYDHNAFVLSFGREWLIADRGYHHFTIPAKTKFTLSTIGHNTVVLDADEAYRKRTKVPELGRDQVRLAGPRIVEFFASDGYDFVRGSAASAYTSKDKQVLTRLDRSILFVKPHFFVVRDELDAPEPHRFSFLLHPDRASDIQTQGDAFTLTRQRHEVFGRLFASSKLTCEVLTYPGAEEYGPFLQATTEPATAAQFTAFLFPRPASRPTLIPNPGFEHGMAAWSPRGAGDTPNHHVDEQVFHSGKRSVRVDKSGYYYSARFSLPAGTKLKATAWIKTTELPKGKGATMTLDCWRENKAFAHKRAGPFAGTDWAQHSLEAAVPEGTEETSLALEFFAPGTCWFDDAEVTSDLKLPEPVTPRVDLLDGGAKGLVVQLGRERHIVLLGKAGQKTEALRLSTDAEAAVVSGYPGRIDMLMMLKGTHIHLEGKPLLEAATLCTVCVSAKGTTVATNLTPHAPLATREQVGLHTPME